ncbi:MAG: bifunctional 5,10-methylenetetrahydrofolate dehydrogenase/5,10-methenyltetrahydrofolate cyclohydrolase [Fimbriimonadaceae bacterium]|nr:bifunctional 5,10-methylenetetrahydrofolate dehydrogenase/5,10-methenyltetrahydrofolate cyclohydrolase [Fimbriimonadaceae bacterium]
MAAKILDGKALSRIVRDEVAARTAQLRRSGLVPRLAAIVAAQDPASLAYVRMKRRWAEEAGIESGTFEVDETSSTGEVLAEIARLNRDDNVHGVLVQHPLPSQVDEGRVLLALSAGKDVDGITPASLGLLVSGAPGFRPATPLGMVTLLQHYGIEVRSKKAVVIGRSVILGKPMAHMLLELDATVSIAHSKTDDLPGLVSAADIVVAACGRPELVRGEWLKPGAVVLDAGFNKVPGREKDVGDCHWPSCSEAASWISPVPGGVGPMTVASLLANTVAAGEAALAG